MEILITPGEPRLVRAKEAAARLGVHTTKVNQYSRDNLLVILKRSNGSFIPEEMLVELKEPAAADPELEDDLPPATHRLVDNLRGTVTLLRDAGFDEEAIVEWLWQENEELGATPIELLRGAQHHAVNRVAATLGF